MAAGQFAAGDFNFWPETGAADAVLVEKRICELLAKDVEEPKLSVSVGVAEFPKNGDSTQAVIAAADAALYRAKADGRDRVVRSAVAPKPSRTSASGRRRRDG